MAPFNEPRPIIQGFKEKIETLAVYGDRLYIGTGTGNLHIYQADVDEDGKQDLKPITTKSLSRRAIEQVGYIKDIDTVVALSESSVTLYPLPDLVPPTPLTQVRKAFSFASNSSVESVSADGVIHSFDEAATNKGVPTLVTNLVVGCQRKIVVYSWRDGEAQDVREATLPHSARVITFLKPTVLCLVYSATEHVLFFLETMSTAELTMPVNISASSSAGAYGMTALSGLGGYMTLGLAAKTKPLAVTVGEDVLIPKDNAGLFFGADGKSKPESLIWNAPPEDVAYAKPYVLSICSSGTYPVSSLTDPSTATASPAGLVQCPVVEIQSSLSLQTVQSFTLPATASGTSSGPNMNHTIRLLTASPAAKAPVFAVSTPTERNAAASEGSSIWMLQLRSWGEQIDELVDGERYTDALALLNTLDAATLPDKDAREAKIRGLNAVAQFRQGNFNVAIDAFIELDISPAKVVALFPESVSGRLHVPPEGWIPLFGGPQRDAADAKSITSDDTPKRASSRIGGRTPSPSNSLRSKIIMKTVVDAMRPAAPKDDDSVSIRGRMKEKGKDPMSQSIETLLRYLSDRRPKVGGALEAVNITPSQSHKYPFLSEASTEDLFNLPSLPLASLSPEQLVRFAQVVDTALFKSYLIIRPGLLGPLCRLPNWCEVSEVEEVLQEREKYSELIFLYNGRKMHSKALSLLRRLSDGTEDVEAKIQPTVSYVQKLGEEYIDQVFEASRWVHQLDSNATFEIFTAELVELPRSKVADFLEELDPNLCARYLEYLIQEREETSTLFHDRLAELYLEMAVNTKKRHDNDAFDKAYEKLMDFIQTSDIYRVDRLFGLLPSDDLFEAKAVLLGRLGKHEGALEVYVYRLHDFIKAEEYCKSIYAPDSPTQGIFLSLLKIYLEPTQKQQTSLLQPALELISRQSPRIDTVETLRLLPPLVTAQDVKAFLCEATRKPIFDTKVVREIRRSRNDQVGRKLMVLQGKRVKVTDSRICPQCHKRIGTSVIAVHAPRGEVTHYQCREAFSRRHVEHTH